jgi:hypothetical protein
MKETIIWWGQAKRCEVMHAINACTFTVGMTEIGVHY